MAHKKKRRKSHNPDKRARRVFENTVIWYWESNFNIEIRKPFYDGYAMCGAVPRHMTHKDVLQVAQRTNNWSICCRAIALLGDDPVIESVWANARDVKLTEIGTIYEELRIKCLEHRKFDQIIDVGWLAMSFKDNPEQRQNERLKLGEINKMRQLRWQTVDDFFEREEERLSNG